MIITSNINTHESTLQALKVGRGDGYKTSMVIVIATSCLRPLIIFIEVILSNVNQRFEAFKKIYLNAISVFQRFVAVEGVFKGAE